MRDFNYSLLKDLKWDSEIVNYLTAIHEAKGKQELYLKQRPERLDKLIEIAKIQSTEFSNEIEGIRTTNTRLKRLLTDKTAPKNRDEEEIAGYRDVLNVIHESFEYIPVTANYILQLHKILFSHSGKSIGGKFKNVQNYITLTENGKESVLFTPPAPYETPAAIDKICNEFNIAVSGGEVDPLILIPIFIHDFLCIHPFSDGNGRMSRLLTTLLLYRNGYMVGKYISLESKIAKNKNAYYDALEKSQEGWNEGREDFIPFVKYLLGSIIAAYRDFEDRMEIVTESDSALDMVRKAVAARIGKFTKTDIVGLCPSLSNSSVESSLKKLAEEGLIEKRGASRATYYVRTDKV
ncbi:MAG: Fic family protein [Christensenellales bacterium]